MKVAGISIILNVALAIGLISLYSNYSSLERSLETCKVQRGTGDLQTSNLRGALTDILTDEFTAVCGKEFNIDIGYCRSIAREVAWEHAHNIANRTE